MTIEHVQPSEHAQVGAMLARCSYYSVERTHDGWKAEVEIECAVFFTGTGKTQLEAIRAAVEAAEQGVMG